MAESQYIAGLRKDLRTKQADLRRRMSGMRAEDRKLEAAILALNGGKRRGRPRKGVKV